MEPDEQRAWLAHFQVKPVLVDMVREAQELNQECANIKRQVQDGKREDFIIQRDGALVMGNRLYVPKDNEVVKKEILHEAHISAYVMHPGNTKLYHIIRPFYYRLE